MYIDRLSITVDNPQNMYGHIQPGLVMITIIQDTTVHVPTLLDHTILLLWVITIIVNQ